jgi:methionyl-tRNA formyltransferase
MKIFITTMDEPLYTNDFIKRIILARKHDIIGVAISHGDRLKITKKRSTFAYVISLLLIMGCNHFVKHAATKLIFILRNIVSQLTPFANSASIAHFSKTHGIKTYFTKSLNSAAFLSLLKQVTPDVIINQAQDFLQDDFLGIPTVGVINRHNALLPKNRGRLSPFWVLYRGEKETGVSIHFVVKKLDAGDIIVQEKVRVEASDDFNSIVKRCYKIASPLILRALDILEKGKYTHTLIKNEDEQATYNSIPTLRQAFLYRLRRIKKRWQ